MSDYEHCLHTENTGQKRLVRPVEEPSNNADNEDNFERSKNITELVSSDSVVAVNAEDDNIEYYMLKVTSGNSFEYIVCTVLTLQRVTLDLARDLLFTEN